MSQLSGEQLYQLLPAMYRVRDAEIPNHPLRQLLDALAEQAARLETDIDGLYENWFVETCEEWVVPYLADLLGVRGLLPPRRAGWSQRALVANTLRYRRRKGTLPLLEQLANDVAGWPARAVELFNAVGITQHVDHLRPGGGTANLREATATQLVGCAFDAFCYTPDIRVMASARPVGALDAERPLSEPGRRLMGVGKPRPNLPNVALFVYRLRPFGSTHATAYSHGKERFSFSPIGHDMALFNRPRERDFTAVAQPLDLPLALPNSAAEFDVGSVLCIYDRNDKPVPSDRLQVCTLRGDDGSWAHPDPDERAPVAYVDVQHGRILFTKRVQLPLRVSYTTAFADTLGGGDYDRRRTASDQVDVFDSSADIHIQDGHAALDQSLARALATWTSRGRPNTTIAVDTDATVARSPAARWLKMDLGSSRLTIRAGNLHRPVIIGDIVVTGTSASAQLTLSGLLVAGQVRVEGQVGKLTLVDCTLVPGSTLTLTGAASQPERPSLIVNNTAARPTVHVDHCIVGPLRIPNTAGELLVRDSIVDAPEPETPTGQATLGGRHVGLAETLRPYASVFASPVPVGGQLPAIAGERYRTTFRSGPSTRIERSTIFGSVRVSDLPLAEDVLFTSELTIDHPEGSLQRNCALPTTAERPAFTAACYGQPGYAQLSLACAPALRMGGTDGAEIGVFHNLRQPQREGALLAQLEEYLRLGLEGGIVYVT